MLEDKKQRISRRTILPLIVVLILANIPPSLLPTATAAQEPEFPDGYVGTWEGTGTQTDADGNFDGEWTITLTLTGGPVGSVAGTVNYPGLGCSGELTYLGPDHPTHGQGILLSEDITVGEGPCVDGGTFLLSSGSNSSLYFYWESPDEQTTATGDLPQIGATASDETGSGHVMIWTMTCPETNSTETGISVTAQLINVDPGPTCYGVESPLTFTITDAAGNATSYTTAPPDSLEFDLPFGTYTITETSSGATETFELTAREDDPEYCLDYAGCALIIVGVPEGGQAQAEGDAEVHFTGTGCDLASIPNDLRHEAPGFDAVSEADGDCYNFVLSGFGYAWPLTALDVIQPDGDFAFDDPQGFLTYPDNGGSGDIPPEFGFVLFFANATSYPTGSWQLYVLDLDGNSVSYTFEYPGPDQQPAGEALLPIEFGGTWTGTVQQYADEARGAREDTYPVELTLTAGAVGPVVGTIDYPTLGCGGELVLVAVNIDSVELSENITYDDTSDGNSCAEDGGIILRFVDAESIEWTGFWPDGTPGGKATLTSNSTVANTGTEAVAATEDEQQLANYILHYYAYGDFVATLKRFGEPKGPLSQQFKDDYVAQLYTSPTATGTLRNAQVIQSLLGLNPDGTYNLESGVLLDVMLSTNIHFESYEWLMDASPELRGVIGPVVEFVTGLSPEGNISAVNLQVNVALALFPPKYLQGFLKPIGTVLERTGGGWVVKQGERAIAKLTGVTARSSAIAEVVSLANRYILSDDRYINHILRNHGPSSTVPGKSRFSSSFDIRAGIEQALRSPDALIKPNTGERSGYIFELTYSSSIGATAQGRPLNTLKVVIDETGNVVTAFPVR